MKFKVRVTRQTIIIMSLTMLSVVFMDQGREAFGLMSIIAAWGILLYDRLILTKARTKERLKAEIKAIFETINEDAFGIHWIGKQSEVVLVEGLEGLGKYDVCNIRVLAINHEQSWYWVGITSVLQKNGGHMVSLEGLNWLKEQGARKILKQHPALYDHYFGYENQKAV